MLNPKTSDGSNHERITFEKKRNHHPPIVKFFNHYFGYNFAGKSKILCQLVVLILTFMSYASLHACRKALPVVKNRLQGNCSTQIDNCVAGFEPFDLQDSSKLFGILDASWAFSYAFGMLFMGQLAEHSCPKNVLLISLFGTGVLNCMFGMGYFVQMHKFTYYIGIQVLNGIFQSGGWPSIIPLVSNWVARNKVGVIMGIWGNHYAVGNIIGQSIASIYVDKEWGMAFIINGFLCLITALLTWFLLSPKPSDVGFNDKDFKDKEQMNLLNENKDSTNNENDNPPVSFIRALFIPGVLEFSFSLFFCKVVMYTFLFWLPVYINSVGIIGFNISPSTAGYLAALFDLGGIGGNIIAGILMDLLKKGGILCFILHIFSAISLFVFSKYGNLSFTFCVGLLMLSGFFVNAPHSLITGAISSNLGYHPSLKGDSSATATVSAIIDGVGCFGAAIAPLVVGLISSYGWDYVMYALMVSSVFSAMLLIRLVYQEIS